MDVLSILAKYTYCCQVDGVAELLTTIAFISTSIYRFHSYNIRLRTSSVLNAKRLEKKLCTKNSNILWGAITHVPSKNTDILKHLWADSLLSLLM